MTTETIGQKIERLEANGTINPECDYCKSHIYPELRETGELPVCPRHKAGSRCRSGAKPHCTCDGCF